MNGLLAAVILFLMQFGQGPTSPAPEPGMYHSVPTEQANGVWLSACEDLEHLKLEACK